MNNDLKRACRAFEKLYSTITEGWHEADKLTAAFDCGEFSSRYMYAKWEEAEQRALHIIARGFGIDKCDLKHALMEREYDESKQEYYAWHSRNDSLGAWHGENK